MVNLATGNNVTKSQNSQTDTPQSNKKSKYDTGMFFGYQKEPKQSGIIERPQAVSQSQISTAYEEEKENVPHNIVVSSQTETEKNNLSSQKSDEIQSEQKYDMSKFNITEQLYSDTKSEVGILLRTGRYCEDYIRQVETQIETASAIYDRLLDLLHPDYIFNVDQFNKIFELFSPQVEQLVAILDHLKNEQQRLDSPQVVTVSNKKVKTKKLSGNLKTINTDIKTLHSVMLILRDENICKADQHENKLILFFVSEMLVKIKAKLVKLKGKPLHPNSSASIKNKSSASIKKQLEEVNHMICIHFEKYIMLGVSEKNNNNHKSLDNLQRRLLFEISISENEAEKHKIEKLVELQQRLPVNFFYDPNRQPNLTVGSYVGLINQVSKNTQEIKSCWEKFKEIIPD